MEARTILLTPSLLTPSLLTQLEKVELFNISNDTFLPPAP